jgi:hypothetical protein
VLKLDSKLELLELAELLLPPPPRNCDEFGVEPNPKLLEKERGRILVVYVAMTYLLNEGR